MVVIIRWLKSAHKRSIWKELSSSQSNGLAA
jgi:hypothetical protein